MGIILFIIIVVLFFKMRKVRFRNGREGSGFINNYLRSKMRVVFERRFF